MKNLVPDQIEKKSQLCSYFIYCFHPFDHFGSLEPFDHIDQFKPFDRFDRNDRVDPFDPYDPLTILTITIELTGKMWISSPDQSPKKQLKR